MAEMSEVGNKITINNCSIPLQIRNTIYLFRGNIRGKKVSYEAELKLKDVSLNKIEKIN